MKYLFPVVALLIFNLFTPILNAQIYENSQGFGLFASPKKLLPLASGAWGVIGESTPFPGADSLYLLIYDAEAKITFRKTLKVPQGERHYIHDALVLADQTFLIAFESTLCDVVGDQTILQKINQNGEILWEKISNWGDENALPHKLMLTPDGNVIGLRDNKFSKINVLDGHFIWTKDVADQTENGYIFDCQLLPNSEDIVLTYSNFLITFKQEGTPIDFNYVVTENLNFEPNYPGKIQVTNDWIYTYNSSFNFAARSNAAGTIEILPTIADMIFDYTIKNNEIYWIGRQMSGKNVAVKTDLLGNILTDYAIQDAYLCGQRIVHNGTALAITGFDGYGPTCILDGEYNPQLDESANWLRIQKGTNGQILSENLDVRISEVKQNTPVETELFGNPPYVFQNYEGGSFEVKITNNSPFTLNSVYINIRFEYNFFSAPCLNRPGVQRFYSNLNLAPNASMWVPFGDILAYGQENEPNKFCFFTSSPNNLPDTKHDNDWQCLEVNTPTNAPLLENLTFLPNPCIDFFEVSLKDDMTNLPWQFIDTNGRVVLDGKSNFLNKLVIPVFGVANGVYYFRIKNSVVRVVVLN
jgi:hypothetical protein